MIAIRQNSVSRVSPSSQKSSCETRYKASQRRWTLVLAATATTTLIMAVLGMSLGMVSLLHLIPAGHPLTTVGVVLLALTFPGLIFTAHCLDRIDEAMHAIKIVEYEESLNEAKEKIEN